MPTDAETRRNPSANSGFTLVEVVVSAAILGIAAYGLFSLTSDSHRMAVNQTLARRAYQELDRTLQDRQFSNEQWSHLWNNASTIFLTDTVVLDELDTSTVADDRTGQIDVAVMQEQVGVSTALGNVSGIAALRITATITWDDLSHTGLTATMEKLITAQRG